MAALWGLGFMMISGAAGIPGGFAEIDQAYQQARKLCDQAKWTQRRTKQLKVLIAAGKDLRDKYFEPAQIAADTSVANWQLNKTLLTVNNRIFYINVGVLSIVMVVYVLLAWFMLMKKRNTLQQAFAAVKNIRFE